MRRYLVVANQTLAGEALAQKLRERVAEGPCRFHILVPATRLSPGGYLWSREEARNHAQRQLERALERFSELGAEVDGEVGDADPVGAVAEVMGREDFEAIILSTLPPGMSRWLGLDLVHRLRRRFKVPVIHVESWEDVPAHGWHPW